MNIIIFIIILGALFYYFVIVKNGNLSFWKKATKNPDFVFEQLLEEGDVWVINEGGIEIDRKIFDGPFFLYIPSIGKTVKFYGKIGKYEDSQKRIEEKINRLK